MNFLPSTPFPQFRILASLFVALLLSAAAADAAWWWPFGGEDDDWVSAPRAEQDARAVGLMERAQAAQQAGNSGSALDTYEDIYKSYPGSRYAPEALYQVGILRMQRRDWKKAFEAFQRLIGFYPDFPQFNQVVRNQFDIATQMAEGYSRYWGFIPFRNYDRAVLYYEQVVRNAPYSPIAPLALMNVAMIHRYRDDIPEAIDALDRLINNYPSNLLAADAYLNLAKTFASLVEGPLYDQGATREAISYYEDFLILYPDSGLVAEAEQGLDDVRETLAQSKFVLGNYFYKYRRNYTAARVFLNETITTYPQSESAARAREILTRIDEIAPERTEEEEVAPSFRSQQTRKRSFWDRLAFWDNDDDDEQEDKPAETQPAKRKRSFWDRLTFWDNDNDEEDEDNTTENAKKQDN